MKVKDKLQGLLSAVRTTLLDASFVCWKDGREKIVDKDSLERALKLMKMWSAKVASEVENIDAKVREFITASRKEFEESDFDITYKIKDNAIHLALITPNGHKKELVLQLNSIPKTPSKTSNNTSDSEKSE